MSLESFSRKDAKRAKEVAVYLAAFAALREKYFH